MKKSKLLNIKKWTLLRNIYGYNFVIYFYNHEVSRDNFSNIYAFNRETQESEYVCYSVCPAQISKKIKQFLISKIIKSKKYV